MKKTDIVIIGAGAVGSALARELAKYKLDVTVVEKNEDLGGDSSKSNSAIIHTGYDAKPGTLDSQFPSAMAKGISMVMVSAITSRPST